MAPVLRFFRLAFAAVLVAHTLVGRASAQTTSTITGRVIDESGAVLPGVAVTARNLDTAVVRPS